MPAVPRADGFPAWTADLTDEEIALLMPMLAPAEAEALDGHWEGWAHPGQRPPETCDDGTPWSTWVLMAGRGFGKTRAGAEWIVEAVAAAAAGGSPNISIALVGATLDEARRVMVEGRSGLLGVAGAWVRDWNPSLRRLTFRTGAAATLFSGASPEQLRGPEHHFAWCDELAKWEKPGETWDMLQLGLRLGDASTGSGPRALVTTTPRPGPHLVRIMEEPGVVVTRGTSFANPHLSDAWKRAAAARYAGTRLGRQELEGELLPDTPGALWSVELLERCRAHGRDCGAIASQRVEPASDGQPATRSGDTTDVTDLFRDGLARPKGHAAMCSGEGRSPARNAPASAGARLAQSAVPALTRPPFTKIVIAVDPPSGDGTCGILACARDAAGNAHVLADHSVAGRTPEGWASAVAAAAHMWSAQDSFVPSEGSPERSRRVEGRKLSPIPVAIVAESNQGGHMVQAVLRTADPSLRVKLVHARHGKADRASPVAMLFEAGKVTLHGRFPELEAQLCGLIAGGAYEGPGASPDRADAMVWALTELLLSKDKPEPRVRGFN